MMRFLFLYILIAGLLNWELVQAQEEIETQPSPIEVGEIAVTAARIPRGVLDVPNRVEIITRDEIRRWNVQNVDEALALVTGLWQRREKGLMGTRVQVSLRGFPEQKRTLVLLDGQPLNTSYTGEMEWNAIPLENIERIEVVKGPLSALYGGNAMGGVVNIITKRPAQRRLELLAGYASNNTPSLRMSLDLPIWRKLILSMGYETISTDGYITQFITRSPSPTTKGTLATGWEKIVDPTGKDAYLVGDGGRNWSRSASAYVNVFYRLTPVAHLVGRITHGMHLYGYDRYHTYLLDENGTPLDNGVVLLPDGKSGFSVKPGNFLSGPGGKRFIICSLLYRHQLHPNLGIQGTMGLTDQYSNWYVTPEASATADGGKGKVSDTPNRRWQAEWQLNISAIKRHSLVAGMSVSRGWARNKEFSLDNWLEEEKRGDITYRAEGHEEVWGLYLQDEIRALDMVNLFLGMRWDYWRTFSGLNQTPPEPETQLPSRSRSDISPKAGIVVKPIRGTTLRASVGKAFRPPTVYELYRTWTSHLGTTFASNPNLLPETTISWETSWDQDIIGWAKLKATYFDNDIKDLIYRVIDPKDPTGKTKIYQNAARARSRGVELEIRGQIVRGIIDGFANLTWQDPRIIQNPSLPDTEGKQITYVPRQTGNIGFNFGWRGFFFSLSGHYVSKIYTKDDNSDTARGVPGVYDPNFIFSIKASYRFGELLSLSVAVDNLLNQKYYQYYLAPKRTIWAQLSWGLWR